MIYALSSSEVRALRQAISLALSIPYIAGIEGYAWESVFHQLKGIPIPDPHSTRRSKQLFDAVDPIHRIGWSLKAIQKKPVAGMSFEVVIQRADILKKRTDLGFADLTLDSPPVMLGEAILAHWNRKIESDMSQQGVTSPRIAILCKSSDHRRYAFMDQDLKQYALDELNWYWTDDSRNGLQARHQQNNATIFRWYPNQKQLFQMFTLEPQASLFDIDLVRFSPNELLRRLARHSK